MKISSAYSGISAINSQKNYNFYKKNNNTSNSLKYNERKFINNISFLGTTVHIVDGGEHADNMQHFANAISNDMDIEMHYVEVNSKNRNTKQLKSLEKELKKLNENQNIKGQYIAIPALASVPLLNLQDQYNRIMYEDKVFTPENIKSNKEKILSFLEKIYYQPTLYAKYIGYMDQTKQGIEYTYGVIKEINQLVKKGAHVYVPSGHPQDETLKWLAKERGKNDELYHFIASGEDINNSIEKLHDEIKSKNWYDFNLLSLSEANIVGVKNSSGAQDYMFAAYDSCITDGARGVYNFSPVIKNGEIIGYSYTDTVTNQYPYEEFPANDQIANLNKFVGRYVNNYIATDEDVEKLKKETDINKIPDKLYHVSDVFTANERIQQKTYLKGRLVDRTKKLFFDANSTGEIIFPKCDCEGTGKPSVMSMWGSCFSTINAIARDINKVNKLKPNSQIAEHEKEYKKIMQEAEQATTTTQSKSFYEKAIEFDKAYKLTNPSFCCNYEPFLKMANISISEKDFKKAEGYLNNGINLACDEYVQTYNEPFKSLTKEVKRYKELKEISENYDKEIKIYNSKPFYKKWFEAQPFKPLSYGEHTKYEKYIIADKQIEDIAKMFKLMEQCLKKQNKEYPAVICQKAYADIQERTIRGEEIIKKRSRGICYIGDLYSEIKPH